MAKIALFGGAFDPIHRGHLAVAKQALAMLSLDEVRFLPCASPVHKASCQASGQKRAKMIALAIHEQPGLSLDTSELDRGGPSYAIDTIEQFIHCHGASLRLYWLLGEDALLGFCRWHRWQDILALVNLVVVHRGDQDAAELKQVEAALLPLLHHHGHALYWLPMELQPQASSKIRQHLAGLSDVPEVVKAYIEAEHLYC